MTPTKIPNMAMVPELPWARTLRRQHKFGARASWAGRRRPGATDEECLVFLLRQLPICHALLEALIPRWVKLRRSLPDASETERFDGARQGALAAWMLCHMYGDCVPHLVAETRRRTDMLDFSAAAVMELAWMANDEPAFRAVDGLWREHGPLAAGRAADQGAVLWRDMRDALTSGCMSGWQRQTAVAMANRMELGQYRRHPMFVHKPWPLILEAFQHRLQQMFRGDPCHHVLPLHIVHLAARVLAARPDIFAAWVHAATESAIACRANSRSQACEQLRVCLAAGYLGCARTEHFPGERRFYALAMSAVRVAETRGPVVKVFGPFPGWR